MDRLSRTALALSKEPIKVMEGEYLKIADNRTGKSYDISVKESKDAYYVSAKDFTKIKGDDK